jgi:hypothetical protein
MDTEDEKETQQLNSPEKDADFSSTAEKAGSKSSNA